MPRSGIRPFNGVQFFFLLLWGENQTSSINAMTSQVSATQVNSQYFPLKEGDRVRYTYKARTSIIHDIPNAATTLGTVDYVGDESDCVYVLWDDGTEDFENDPECDLEKVSETDKF